MFPIASNSDDGDGDGETLYSDSVFSSYVYTGKGAPGAYLTNTINNGIDLSTYGGMVWTKTRDSRTYMDNIIYDTARGTSHWLMTNTTGQEAIVGGTIDNFNTNGFTLGVGHRSNEDGGSYASWTFRKAAKFFDVVTWTGNGVAGRQIAHSLGVAPGMILIKSTSTIQDWHVYHRSMGSGMFGVLNASDVFYSSPNTWDVTSTTFGSNGLGLNNTGQQYVAYLFAHDTSSTGIIQCGSFTASSGAATVTLGYEPQWIMFKRTDSSIGGNWHMVDTMRGWSFSAVAELSANASTVEDQNAFVANPTATGFSFGTGTLAASGTYIYMAIRRLNKPPTTGTQVYNAIARAGTGAAATVTGVGFAPDYSLIMERNRGGNAFLDRVRGAKQVVFSNNTLAEVSSPDNIFFNQDGINVGADTGGYGNNQTSITYINHFFKRAPGFFDIVCYTGTGVARTLTHNLTVLPKLVILKKRNGIQDWWVWHRDGEQFNGSAMKLNATDRYGPYGWNVWGNGAAGLPVMTDLTFSIGDDLNTASANYISYLFATLAGISKVGSYTGNGSSQNIECGFAAGARFILIKRTDSTGDWYVWDTARGIVTGNDPHLSLNTSGPEVTTDDSIDPYSPGFTVNQVAATNINVTSATYIFLAIS